MGPLAALVLAGCAGDDSDQVEAPTVVALETQRCEQPNRFHGVGVVVGEDLVLTAGHVVEGDLRELSVDGEPARVVVIDLRTDLAVITADVPDADEPTLAGDLPDEATMLGPEGAQQVDVERSVTLVVEHATDDATYRRDVVVFTPGVVDGDSGSPLVDDAGRLAGIVIADRDGEGIAAAANEVEAVLETAASADDLTLPDPPGTC